MLNRKHSGIYSVPLSTLGKLSAICHRARLSCLLLFFSCCPHTDFFPNALKERMVIMIFKPKYLREYWPTDCENSSTAIISCPTTCFQQIHTDLIIHLHTDVTVALSVQRDVARGISPQTSIWRDPCSVHPPNHY